MELNIIHLPTRKDRWTSLTMELAEQNIKDYKIWNGIIDATLTHRGISQAHKQVIRYAQDRNLPEVLVGEDDLRFTAKGAFQYFLANKPNDFDLYLGGIYHGNIEKNKTVDDFSGLTMYIVHRKFYKKFLSLPETLDIDRSLKDTGRFVVCDPFVVTQYNGFSDNCKTYTNDDHFLKGRKLFGHLN